MLHLVLILAFAGPPLPADALGVSPYTVPGDTLPADIVPADPAPGVVAPAIRTPGVVVRAVAPPRNAPLSGSERLASGERFTDRWRFTAELNYSEQSGSRSLQVFSGGLDLSHQQKDEFRLDARLQSRLGHSDGEMVTRNDRGELSFDLTPQERVAPFLFSEAERDAMRRIRLRMSNGAGAKYTPARTSEGREIVSVSLALLHSYERLLDEVPVDGGVVELVPSTAHRARWSLRLRGEHDLRPGARVHYRTFYQPVWDELANYLLRSEAGLRIDLTERLGLSMVYQWDREQAPDAPRAPDERLFRTGLVLSL